MLKRILSLSLLSFLVVSCAGEKNGISENVEPPSGREESRYEGLGKLFGDEAFKFSADGSAKEETTGIGVNSYLWRAALDTVSFIPIQTADPFGGLILTDWYSPQETPNERLKLNILILDRQLRTDGVRAKIFRQVRAREKAEWKDIEVAPETVIELENTILTRARELRVAAEQ